VTIGCALPKRMQTHLHRAEALGCEGLVVALLVQLPRTHHGARGRTRCMWEVWCGDRPKRGVARRQAALAAAIGHCSCELGGAHLVAAVDGGEHHSVCLRSTQRDAGQRQQRVLHAIQLLHEHPVYAPLPDAVQLQRGCLAQRLIILGPPEDGQETQDRRSTLLVRQVQHRDVDPRRRCCVPSGPPSQRRW
jgi:hypothetical protein